MTRTPPRAEAREYTSLFGPPLFIAAALLALLSFVWGCAPVRPPGPPDPRPPSFVSRVTVLTEQRQAVEGLTCALQVDTLDPIACTYDGLTATFTLPAHVRGWGAVLSLSAPGRVGVAEERVQVAPELGERLLAPDYVPPPRLVPVGQFLRTERNERFTVIEITDFNLFNRFLQGEDIRPVLQQRASFGFNVLRVWTAYDVCPSGVWPDGRPCQPIGRLVPREHPDYDGQLRAFLRLVSRYGLYVELTAFTGVYDVTLPTEADKVAHWERLIAVAQAFPTVGWLELVNEYDHPANRGLPFEQLREPPAPVLASRGSAIKDALPKQPYWSLVTYHPGDGPEWMRKVAHNGMEDVAWPSGRPVIANETVRFPDADTSAVHAHDAAKGAALLIAGSAYHCVACKASLLLTGVEADAARAWAQGARAIPLACQDGLYRRIDDPTFLRIYERLGAGPGCRVDIRH